jgi:hypothetical protein
MIPARGGDTVRQIRAQTPTKQRHSTRWTARPHTRTHVSASATSSVASNSVNSRTPGMPGGRGKVGMGDGPEVPHAFRADFRFWPSQIFLPGNVAETAVGASQ